MVSFNEQIACRGAFSRARFWQLVCKEWHDQFSQFTAYAVIAVFFAIVAYSFTTVLFFQRNVSIVHALSQAANLMILVVPLLTMRQFSKERESGTLELLLSAGCSELEIFAAKLFVIVLLITTIIMLCLSFPLALAYLGRPDVGLLAGSYTGLWLMSVSLTAIGLCIACFIANPLIAAMTTFGVFVVLWTIDIASYLLPPVMQELAEILSFDIHLSRFFTGAIYLSDVTFFVLIISTSILLGVARLSIR